MSRIIDPNHIVELHGKSHVTYEGLLSMATDEGLESLEVDIRQLPTEQNKNTCVCIATAKCKGRTFTDVGDANPANVNSMISKHIIRMASTRAKARALRDMLNIGMCAVEELEGTNGGSTPTKTTTTKTGDPAKTTNLKCQKCGKSVSKAVEKYCGVYFEGLFCPECQKDAPKKKK